MIRDNQSSIQDFFPDADTIPNRINQKVKLSKKSKICNYGQKNSPWPYGPHQNTVKTQIWLPQTNYKLIKVLVNTKEICLNQVISDTGMVLPTSNKLGKDFFLNMEENHKNMEETKQKYGKKNTNVEENPPKSGKNLKIWITGVSIVHIG